MSKAASRPAPQASEPEWIDQKTAAEILGVKPHSIRSMLAQGHLSVRVLPGTRRRYRRDEVEQMAGSCVQPASTRRK